MYIEFEQCLCRESLFFGDADLMFYSSSLLSSLQYYCMFLQYINIVNVQLDILSYVRSETLLFQLTSKTEI